jgi:membrane protein
MAWPGWKPFLKELARAYHLDAVADVAGALTFYSILALFPFLLFMVALASKVVTPATTQALLDQVAMVAPEQVTHLVEDRVYSLQHGPTRSILTVGFVGALWAASSGMAALITALNRAYGVRETRPFWRVRALAIAATFVAVLLTVVAAALAVAVPAVARHLGPFGAAALWLRLPVSALILMVLWGLMYRWLPAAHPPGQARAPGSIVGVVLWSTASWGFSTYAQSFGKYEVTYGALGGVIVLLTWMWISGQVLLLGAIVNRILTPTAVRAQRG